MEGESLARKPFMRGLAAGDLTCFGVIHANT